MWFINYFHIQILVIESLFYYQLQKKSHFWFRAIPSVLLYIILPALLPDAFYNRFSGWEWIPLACLFMLVLSGIIMRFCYRINLRQVIFYCCVAHTLQHMVHCLYRITVLSLSVSVPADQIIFLLYLLASCAIFFVVLKNRFRGSDTADIQNNYLLMFSFTSILVVYGISSWMDGVEGETICARFFAFFSCLLLVMLMLDFFRIRQVERDQMIMERLLRQEQEQHEMNRDTVDVINRKCHDLRHQIAALRHMSRDERDKSISDLENAVLIYDGFPKSGNKDVDIILAEKSLLAEKNNIVIRSIVDGEKLSFMGVEDLYSLLGNALDNAIEAASQEQDEARRIITLYAAAKNELFTIHIENPCAKEPLFMDGLPVTTKSDIDYHGYGMRSMRYLCEKYHGVLTTGWEGGIFSLDILFPLQRPLTSE